MRSAVTLQAAQLPSGRRQLGTGADGGFRTRQWIRDDMVCVAFPLDSSLTALSLPRSSTVGVSLRKWRHRTVPVEVSHE
jgi:hypothetical protein